MQKEQYELIIQGRKVLIIASINISIMMVTNSVFSALSPYLWLGEVFTKSMPLVHFYSSTTTLFYIANTFFAILVIYIIYSYGVLGFDQDEENNILQQIDSGVTNVVERARQNPYLNLDETLEYGSIDSTKPIASS